MQALQMFHLPLILTSIQWEKNDLSACLSACLPVRLSVLLNVERMQQICSFVSTDKQQILLQSSVRCEPAFRSLSLDENITLP